MYKQVLNTGLNIRRKDIKTVYYLITFVSDFGVSTLAATYVLFLLSQGLNFLQVNLVNLVFMIGIFIFEIPTGAYADYFGRKKSVILSGTCITLALLMYFFSSSIFMFIIAETLAALAFTFESGALDAWLIDSLEQKSFIGRTDFVFSHASIIGKLAALLGGLVGAYAGASNLRNPMLIGAGVSAVSVIITIFFMEEDFIKAKTFHFGRDIKNMIKASKESVKYSVVHRPILWIILASLLTMFAFMPLNMYWSPRLNMLAGNQIWLLGWVWAGISLFMMFGSFIGRFFSKKGKSYLWIFLTTALFLSVPIFPAALSNTFYAVLSGFMIYEIGRGLIEPVQKSFLNRHIQLEQRATVLSFVSMIGRVGAMFGLVIFGWVAKNHSIQNAWLASGVLLLFLIPIYMKATEEEKVLFV